MQSQPYRALAEWPGQALPTPEPAPALLSLRLRLPFWFSADSFALAQCAGATGLYFGTSREGTCSMPCHTEHGRLVALPFASSCLGLREAGCSPAQPGGSESQGLRCPPLPPHLHRIKKPQPAEWLPLTRAPCFPACWSGRSSASPWRLPCVSRSHGFRGFLKCPCLGHKRRAGLWPQSQTQHLSRSS